MTRLQQLAESEWNRSHSPLTEEVVRRVRGDSTNIETVNAIVEIDTAAAGLQTSTGGVQQQQDRSQIEHGARIEVGADQEVHQLDTYEIGGRLWRVAGTPIGEDAGSKTVVLVEVNRVRGRQPNVSTR